MPFYAVNEGRRPGIYTSWSECSEQISGFAGAQFRKFPSYNQAAEYLYSRVIIAYADGACINNGRPDARAGFGVWFESPDHKHSHTAYRLRGDVQTNNRAEITALIVAIQMSMNDGRDLIICSDSQYAMNTVAVWIDKWQDNGYRNANGAPIANKDIIMELVNNLNARRQRVLLRYVPAHKGVLGNVEADRLARYGATLPRDDL